MEGPSVQNSNQTKRPFGSVLFIIHNLWQYVFCNARNTIRKSTTNRYRVKQKIQIDKEYYIERNLESPYPRRHKA